MLSRRAMLGSAVAGGSLWALGGCAGPMSATPSLANRLTYPEGRLREATPPQAVDIDPPVIHAEVARSVLGSARLHLLYDRASWAEGPAWWPQQQTLVFSDVIGRRILGWRDDGAIDVIQDATAFINGNAIDANGRFYHCEHGRRAVSTSRPGTLPRVLAHRADGERLNSPNDLVIAEDGAIWFSDPTFGIDNPQEGVPEASASGRTSICRLAPGASEAERLADLTQPNGVGFSPDGTVFYASQTPPDQKSEIGIYAFDRIGQSLGERRLFARVPEGLPDGFAVDRRGWLWSSSGRGIEVFDDAARHLATIPTPTLASNCTFDSGEDRLFVTGDSNVWMIAF